MEKKIVQLFVIISILIIIILTAIGIIYSNISTVYPDPDPSIDFEEDESSGNGWLNLTVIGLKYVKNEMNWHDFECMYNTGIILNGPEPLFNLTEDSWGYSGEDNVVSINDKLYIHAKPNTAISIRYIPSNTVMAHQLEVE